MILVIFLDKVDNLNNNNYYNQVESTIESLSKNFDLNREDVLHPTSSKTIMMINL